MKRFSPYTKYQMNGVTRYASSAPDGVKKDSPRWHADRINEIRYIFLRKNENNQFKLKKHQWEIMRSILSGHDTFVILPTGSGKSLCFQAPSIFFPGLTLVVTPLVALMEDQVERFNQNAYPIYHPAARNFYQGIRFKAIYPGMDGLSVRATFSEILHPAKTPYGREVQYKFLYVSPERLSSPKFLRALEEAEADGLRINHVVIDEVHCMSQWGFEFRESYLALPQFISRRPVRPIISAFTATATPKDIAEIKNILGFPTNPEEYEKRKYAEIFHIEPRGNLSLRVTLCSDFDSGETASRFPTRQDALLGILGERLTKVCIIYRTTAVGVDELYDTLRENPLLRDRLAKYHAQMSKRAKRRNKNAFLRSREDAGGKPCQNIMIATKAFGMGIDKRDISLVIHYDMPRSLEDYYQEAGRAGRDEKKVPVAECVLLYSPGPRREKGTLSHTADWVISERGGSAGCMPVASQFSPAMRENIFFWSYYRLCYVAKYCGITAKRPEAANAFLMRYLRNAFSPEQAAADFEAFYALLEKRYAATPEMQSALLQKCIRGDEAARFLLPHSQQAEGAPNPFHGEIKRLVGEVNELHINNTYVANLLRHHPEAYEPGKPFVLPESMPGAGQEWKSRQNKRVKGEPSLTLRPVDIAEDAAFLFAPGPSSCEGYANAAWDARQNKSRGAKILFTVDSRLAINGVLEQQEGRWRAVPNEPYLRYLGCNVKGLFPLEQYGGWRRTRQNAGSLGNAGDADSLFAYAAGARPHRLSFTLHGGEKLTYFDLCVLDAVYSIEAAGKGTVYVQTIWEILTGRNPAYSSQEKLSFRRAIQGSIDKMRAMTLTLWDNQCGFSCRDSVFLPLKDKPKGQKGYAYTELPPLFRYAEALNGQIIKVPVSLLDVSKVETQRLWREDFRAALLREGLENDSPDGLPRHALASQVKRLPQRAIEEGRQRAFLSAADSARLEGIKKHAYAFTPSLPNALLCHYLLHRIAISKNRKRGNYILFSTIRHVLGLREDSCLFQKKAAALLAHWRRAGYLRSYYFYLSDYAFRLSDGTEAVDTAYFRAEPVPVAKYWRKGRGGHIVYSDFAVLWSLAHNRRLVDGNSNFEIRTRLANALDNEKKTLSPDEKRALAVVPLGRMDGIVLRHKWP